MSGYLTGLGVAAVAVVPPGTPSGYAAALTKLDQQSLVRSHVSAIEGLHAFLVEWSARIETNLAPPLSTFIVANTEWLPAMEQAGYADLATSVRANLRSAGTNAGHMANRIVLLRSTKDPAYAAAKWEADPTSAQHIRINEVPSNKALLAVLESEMGMFGSIFNRVPTGASQRWAMITPQQFTRLQMMLWWQAIEQAATNITLAREDFLVRRQGAPPKPTVPPVAPTNPTPNKPEGSTTVLPPALLGVSLLAAIAWWLLKPRRVESL